MTIKKYEEKTYVICHDGVENFQPLIVEAGATLSTMQPIIEEFANSELWSNRLIELGQEELLNLFFPPAPEPTPSPDPVPEPAP